MFHYFKTISTKELTFFKAHALLFAEDSFLMVQCPGQKIYSYLKFFMLQTAKFLFRKLYQFMSFPCGSTVKKVVPIHTKVAFPHTLTSIGYADATYSFSF